MLTKKKDYLWREKERKKEECNEIWKRKSFNFRREKEKWGKKGTNLLTSSVPQAGNVFDSEMRRHQYHRFRSLTAIVTNWFGSRTTEKNVVIYCCCCCCCDDCLYHSVLWNDHFCYRCYCCYCRCDICDLN